jgi:microcystin-dependent protein
MAYNYTNGDGLTALLVTEPNGATEKVSILDNAIRQIKAYLQDPVAGLLSVINRVTAVETSVTTLTANLTLQSIPVGALLDYSVASAPTGWLVCDGAAVSRSTYSALFAVIGVTFGAGNGTTTFNVPDCRSRVTVPADGGTGRIPAHVAGAVGGEYQHTLVEAELATHSHLLPISDPVNPPPGATYGFVTGQASAVCEDIGSLVTSTNREKTSTTGSSTPHNNLQPYLGVANKIIKAQ